MNTNLNDRLKVYFSSISSCRSALMGLAMIAVFLTHAPSASLGFMPTGFIGVISGYGFWGVDVFLFLSAFGLCHSLQKNDRATFFRNRFVRILPLWFFVLISVHIIGVIVSKRLPSLDFSYPVSLADCFYWYSGLGFFFNKCCYEWYIPSLLVLYCISPLLFKCSRRGLYVLILLAIVVYVLNHYFVFAQHLDILLERIPVFCFGFLYFKENKDSQLSRFLVAELILALCVILLIYCGLCSSTVLFGMMVPLVLMTVSSILSVRYLKVFSVCFSFIGSVSLEFYLIHLYRRPQFLCSFFCDNGNIQVILAFALCLFLSYILHNIISYILRLFNVR